MTEATEPSTDAQALATAAIDAMYARDEASRALGIEVVSVEPGRAVTRMTVRPDMVNGLDVCHGGLIFTLADSAMAFASNSYNHYDISTHADIDWLQPAHRGDVLTATATNAARQGRNAVHDVAVVNAAGGLVATFRGRTRRIEGTHVAR
ncbi:MAG: hydroxyphenylacetyl-CoA thioesterase PaaI [Actinomycetota bacterium]